MLKISEISYKNFGKCLKIENEAAGVIVTADIGPRIISYCLAGKENMLFEDTDRAFSDGSAKLREYFGEDKTWYIYGGHRLWSSPESYPHSYVPDNSPVKYTEGVMNGAKAFTFTPPPTRTGQQHSLTVIMDESSANLRIIHELKNISGAIVTMAPWALTVCAPGGVEIFPQSAKDNGLLSNRRNVFWSYSGINDDRFFLGNRYGTLKQVPGSEGKFKIGMNNEDGWAAVVNRGQIFLKRFGMNINGNYPDYGCNFETFTNGLFLECESLGELSPMPDGSSVTLEERWTLIPCEDSFGLRDEDSIDAFVKKHIAGRVQS